jgi:uncharacterized protein YndB with AHSA1/START domain
MMEDTSGVAVERKIELCVGADEVWPFLTGGEYLSIWMEGVVEIDPRPGGGITLNREGMAPVWGTVEEVKERHRIQWSWRTDDGLPTLVEIELQPSEAGTSLTVRETLLPWQVSGPQAKGFDEMSSWSSALRMVA